MDERWLTYLYFFNVEKNYFECHEYGESLWLDTGRPEALKGMIQAAVCLYHLENGNIRGGYSMWLRARQYLLPVKPKYMGIDVNSLIDQINEVFYRVPHDWRDKIVSSKEVAELRLPEVFVKIMDPELRRQMDGFSPSV